MINNLSIRNLRGIKECELSNLGQINLLIGKNSVGKSTILESIQLVSSAMFYPLEQIFALINRRSDRSWHPKELRYTYNDAIELSVSLKFDDGNSVKIETQRGAKDPQGSEFYISGSSVDKPIKIKEFEPSPFRDSRERLVRGGLTTYKPDRRQLNNVRLPESILSFLESVTLVDPIGKTQTSALEEEFQKLKFSGKYDDTLEVLRQIYGEKMRSWELFAYFAPYMHENRTAFMYEGGRPVYVDDLGDGIKYGFAAITLAYNKHDSALLLEEIETHQHPSSLRMLIKSLIEIAKENRLQFFVSTQSPDALRYFKMFYPETKVFLIEKDPIDNVVYAHDEEDIIRVFREVGWDLEDLLQYERIVIVDGIEDEIIIKGFFQKESGHPLESEGVKLFIP